MKFGLTCMGRRRAKNDRSCSVFARPILSACCDPRRVRLASWVVERNPARCSLCHLRTGSPESFDNLTGKLSRGRLPFTESFA